MVLSSLHARTCAVALGLFALAGCGAGQASSTTNPSEAVTVTATAEATVTATATATVTAADETPVAAASEAPVDDSFVMPREVGKVLQTAQDDIQRASGNPLFFTDSTDASGAGRFQLLDRDWRVCSQSIAPGAKVSDDDMSISFAVVRVSEKCP